MLRVMPAGVPHGELSHTDWACYYIGLDLPARPPWPQLYVDDTYGTISALCGTIAREWNGQAADRDTMLALLVRQLDLLLRRAHDQQDVAPSERLVREGERLLRERFAAPITTAAIATSLGVSSSYLRAQFVRLRGQTPIAYLHALRAQHALALIRNSTLSLEAIAKLAGYDSSSHLSRHIKRVTGSRPGTFRGAPIGATGMSTNSEEGTYGA
jgi:AraC-like DNA-binding protein